MGSKKYYKGTAGDNWWLAPLLLGENWHNFHHAFPSDYRNGPKWYQFDVHKWIIFGMSKVGLAWDLDRTPEIRVQAKASETATHFAQGRKQQLTILQEQLDKLASHFYNKLHELEDSSVLIKQKLQKSFLEIQGSLGELAQQLQSSIQLADSDKLLKATYSKYKETESAIYKLINKFDKLKSRAFS
jgi:stearoyl-CoA desaturase (delta-9 desaturase)